MLFIRTVRTVVYSNRLAVVSLTSSNGVDYWALTVIFRGSNVGLSMSEKLKHLETPDS